MVSVVFARYNIVAKGGTGELGRARYGEASDIRLTGAARARSGRARSDAAGSVMEDCTHKVGHFYGIRFRG